MKRFFIVPALALLLVLGLPFGTGATVVGSFNGLVETTDYTEIWKIANASPQALILDDILGDSELRRLYIGNVSAAGCELDVQELSDTSAPSYEVVAPNTIVTINNVNIGVIELDLSPLRCHVGYNFTSLGPIADSVPEPVIEEVPEPEEEEEDDDEITTNFCTDTDGGYAPYSIGTMSHDFDTLSSPLTDVCLDASTVQEYYCSAQLLDGSHVSSASCPYGCQNGRCLYDYEVEEEEEEVESEDDTECVDSDGGYDIYLQGSMTQGDIVSEEYCIDAEDLMEYTCDGTSWTTDQEIIRPCVYGCVEGRCLTQEEANVGPDSENDFEPEAYITSCSDSDNGFAPHTLGSLTLITAETELTEAGDEIIATDECVNSDELLELYCNDRALNQFGYEIVDCPGGCYEGVCVVMYCNETDSGYDRFNGGTMNHQYATVPSPQAVDYCSSPIKLVEYACEYNTDNDNPADDYHESSICTYGCVTDDEGQGRCRTMIESFNPVTIVQNLQSSLSWLLSLLGGN